MDRDTNVYVIAYRTLRKKDNELPRGWMSRRGTSVAVRFIPRSRRTEGNLNGNDDDDDDDDEDDDGNTYAS